MNKLTPFVASGLTVAISLVFASACSSSDDDSSSNPGTGGSTRGTGAGKGGAGAAGAGKGGGGTGGTSAGTGGTGGSTGGAGAGGTSAAGTGGMILGGAGGMSAAGAAGVPCPTAGTGAGGSPAGGAGGMSGSGGMTSGAGGMSTGAGGMSLGGTGGRGAGGRGGRGAGGRGAGGRGGRGAGGRGAGGMSGDGAGGMSLGGMSGSGAGGMSGGGGMGGAPPTCDQIPPLAMGDTSFTLTSPDWGYCMPIPEASTCDAKPFPEGTSPELTWTAGPTGTMSYAVVLKDLSVLARTDPTDPNYNRGYHYVMWNIPTTVMMLPPDMMDGFVSPTVPGAVEWSNFNNYGFFGPCPNFDPTMPTDYDDSYAFEVYALPMAKSDVPAPVTGMSTVRQMDDSFKAVALAVAEYRGTSSAHASVVPCGVLPPMTQPPCPTTGTQPAGCLMVP
jgi:phosphatidylethanolamine-binding protein (PEBP) family uncharacterized protein